MNGVYQFKGNLAFGSSLYIPCSRNVMNSSLIWCRSLERREIVACELKPYLNLLLRLVAGYNMAPTCFRED